MIAVRLDGPGLDAAALEARYADWLVRIRDMHDDARPLRNSEPAFARLVPPLAGARVALLTSAGAYIDGDAPFDVDAPHGDPGFRVLPDDAAPSSIRFAHSHYDTSRAEADPNVVLPRDVLQRLAADGVIGSVSPVHVGMMGFNPHAHRVRDESAPAVVELFARAGVDVVLLSPG